jgi:hypothetical protein
MFLGCKVQQVRRADNLIAITLPKNNQEMFNKLKTVSISTKQMDSRCPQKASKEEEVPH